MPALRQLWNVLNKKQCPERSRSTDLLYENGNEGKGKQVETAQSSPMSATSGFNHTSARTSGEEIEIRYELGIPGTPKNWSPRMIDAPRFERPSLTPEQAQAIKQYHHDKADVSRGSVQWEDGRAKGGAQQSKLSTRPELGYSCEIEGGVGSSED